MAATTAQTGLLAPLANRTFAALWVASIVSSVGTAMQTVGATWTLVQTGANPALVAALQAAGSVPLFLAGLPAGVLADIVDRRKLLIAANLWAAAAAAVLAALAFAGAAPPSVLLAATFAIGLGAAFSAPAFQAIVPELASGDGLAPAVALNSIGMNIARTIGPALGGVTVAAVGAPATFAINAASTLAVVWALAAWRRPPEPRRLPPEHFLGATRASVRYARHAPGVRRILRQAIVFFAIASAPWALLPLIASDRLGLGASGYGTLLGALGVGAVAGALMLTKLRKLFGTRLLATANIVCAAACGALAVVASEALAMAAVALFGAGWITVLTLLNVGIQNAVAGWVRARMLALYVVAYFGAFAAGSLVWGKLADLVGVPEALIVAAVAGLAAAPLLARLSIGGTDLDLSPAASQEPGLILAPGEDHGAVLVSTDYRIDAEESEAFGSAMAELRESRLRTGAFAWRHWTDPADPSFHRESYVVESWTEHMRQTDRRTVADAAAESRVNAMAGSAAKTTLLRERSKSRADYA
ncbi:MFS transporter [Sphingomonas sp. SUN019]|uniref:MFS transporter n=1 Tax=Sphingomonas sp. SUN019 TaxID=2937788 RepID=UPI00216459DE|nr:MFS transporter [Sphingomonas sp. SUN019]UVO49903.1 MFS transporter [Sphingomonas sp. SUN019]